MDTKDNLFVAGIMFLLPGLLMQPTHPVYKVLLLVVSVILITSAFIVEHISEKEKKPVITDELPEVPPRIIVEEEYNYSPDFEYLSRQAGLLMIFEDIHYGV